jgi:hypothetical protein
MKRSEMEAKLAEAIENTFGCDEVGTELCPPSDYIAFVALKCVEELGMLPPSAMRYIDHICTWEKE